MRNFWKNAEEGHSLGRALTWGQGVWRKVVWQEAIEKLADAAQAEARDDLGPYGAVRQHLLGHHQQVRSGPQAREQHVPAPEHHRLRYGGMAGSHSAGIPWHLPDTFSATPECCSSQCGRRTSNAAVRCICIGIKVRLHRLLRCFSATPASGFTYSSQSLPGLSHPAAYKGLKAALQQRAACCMLK